MSYISCDMNCDKETNKSDIEEHCSNCLHINEPTGGLQQELSATKAWRSTSVVEGRGHPNTLSTTLNQEQTHNILKPYYRTIDEPWDQREANDPRITLAAMFKANSTKFREDSVQHQCSRPACQYRTDCYWEREWEQRQGRGMYKYTQCI